MAARSRDRGKRWRRLVVRGRGAAIDAAIVDRAGHRSAAALTDS
jgi:hypothetical protein